MSLKVHDRSFFSTSSSSSKPPVKPSTYLTNGKDVRLYYMIFNQCHTRKKGRVRLFRTKYGKFCADSRSPELAKKSIIFHKSRRVDNLLPFSSADDSVTVNGSPQSTTSNDVGEFRYTLDQSLQDKDLDAGLVTLMHDAARVFELAIKERYSSSKTSWFSLAWPGADKDSWAKALSYQACVYSLLQAAKEISSRGDRRDRDTYIFVQRSLARQSAPLESVITEKLSSKKPEAHDWFWSEQMPAVVTSFVNYFEKERRFAAATALYAKATAAVSGYSSDISLLMLALNSLAAITKLGPTKVSCPQFYSMVPDTTGRLMDMLVEFVPLPQAYHLIKEIGLHREFLVNFGPRAATCRLKSELGAEEIVFWVGLVQKQLQRAIDRERVWSRLTTSESIEVLERDLAIFGFFIALGRSTQSFLIANGFDTIDEPVQGFVRFLIGGSVLYYPQLSAISSYQLYVEVVCEELDWLPFYPGISSSSKRTLEHKHKEGPPNAEAIPLVLDVCSHWIESFIKYSKWLENPSNVKATGFVSKGHNKLKACIKELGIQRDSTPVDNGSESFDKALESVEGALLRLEELIQELHVSSSSSGKEHLKAACSDLERIRKLKKEAEFLEASISAKAASLQQGDVINRQGLYTERKGNGSTTDMQMDESASSSGLWGFFLRRPTKPLTPSSSIAKETTEGYFEQETASEETAESETNEVQRFELLRNELMALEKRVQKSTDQSDNEEEEIEVKDAVTRYDRSKENKLIQVQKKDNILEKSLDKLKETSTDVLEGTQLLAIDVGAALELLRRVLIRDELAEKEKQALRRTLTDVASVVPIGVLMLLPVTAVGHAAMLAAIQRYAPGLIPSTYGPERLDLLRQLKKVKELEGDAALAENAENKPN